MRKILVLTCGSMLTFGLAGCQQKELDVTEPSDKGGPCDPLVDPATADGPHCAEGFVCDPVAGASDTWVCGEPLQIHGTVIDLQTEEPIEGALVNGQDRTGAPLGEIAVTDAMGRYELQVSAPRQPDGELASDINYTLQAFARDYLPFPSGIRVALPIHAAEAAYDAELKVSVIESPLTTVGLVMLPEELRGGVTVTGTVGGVDPGGTLVVAEGVSGDRVAQYGVSDRTGAYTIFNVQSGAATIRGYRRGLELAAGTAQVAAEDLAAVDLEAVAEGEENLGAVSGSVQIVNAPGGSVTSVVLVPVSVFNATLERGPVPFGLRAPDPGLDPDVEGTFRIPGVPAGTYKVLASFENDRLVRDPDTSIGGTELQEVTVAAGEAVTVDAGFKVTEALAVVAPGAEEPTATSATPTFEFADDSSEKGYLVRVFDVFGELVWENAMVPSVSGSKTVEVPYEGPALTSGLYYQFRAISLDGNGVPLSATEDLRGVFLVE
ncbi:carboxypeptidase-like regulatory domain-containing protein [Nannocystis pusilla]|uniref:Carboxypeptidase-like regulatory domain-containing protein n=1 Tax=Nannocystis pusilla TaxID=889268 RepID=A0ABS7TVK2_9BACT|nr:carboxypeptidase-like regulatory domain-containing protein [Nannocystis pusilla]MBZ5712274.1 carboxypeptidase-like regulatory domain-containing protein [Nannocystis pusilla]